jgi:hypothetical protein
MWYVWRAFYPSQRCIVCLLAHCNPVAAHDQRVAGGMAMAGKALRICDVWLIIWYYLRAADRGRRNQFGLGVDGEEGASCWTISNAGLSVSSAVVTTCLR